MQHKAPARDKNGHWLPGNSGNTGYYGESWASMVRALGDMEGKEARERFGAVLSSLGSIPDGVTLKEMAVLSAYAKLIVEPQASLLIALMDRSEGKMPIQVRTWRDEVIDLLKAGEILPEVIVSELGDAAGHELLLAAGMPTSPTEVYDSHTYHTLSDNDVQTVDNAADVIDATYTSQGSDVPSPFVSGDVDNVADGDSAHQASDVDDDTMMP